MEKYCQGLTKLFTCITGLDFCSYFGVTPDTFEKYKAGAIIPPPTFFQKYFSWISQFDHNDKVMNILKEFCTLADLPIKVLFGKEKIEIDDLTNTFGEYIYSMKYYPDTIWLQISKLPTIKKIAYLQLCWQLGEVLNEKIGKDLFIKKLNKQIT